MACSACFHEVKSWRQGMWASCDRSRMCPNAALETRSSTAQVKLDF